MKNIPIIKVIIADDNRFFADSLTKSLSVNKQINVVNTFYNLKTLWEFTATNTAFDILVLDLNFHGFDSLDHIQKIRTQVLDFKIILLTTFSNTYIKKKAQAQQISAVIGKDENVEDFKSIIYNCFNGIPFNFEDNTERIKLSKNKLNVLKSLYEYSDKKETEIANLLNISLSTLKTHKRELFQLTNTINTIDLIKFGIEKGLILVK